MTDPDSGNSTPNSTHSIYNRVFWTAYLANLLLVTGNSLIFRFADWVTLLGGTNSVTGTIASVGTIGALTARVVLGQAIDHYGTRLLWGATSLAFSVGILGMVCCSTIGWEMYVFRVIYAIGVAGMFTCSVVHIQNHAPTHRRTEVIGMLGSSGFLGMIAGTQLGDLFIITLPDAPIRFYWMFGTAVCTGIVYFLLTLILTHNSRHERPHTTPPLFSLLRRYWPGSVISVAATMGLGFAVTTVFLTRFAAEMNLRGVGTFFGGYAVSAFAVRLISRNWSITIGRHRMVVMGLLGHAAGHTILPFITQEWHFLIPAVLCGFGHALLFPCIVSLGSDAFPTQYRGTATTVTLGAIDLGMLVTAPALGWLIDQFSFALMFNVTAGLCTTMAFAYTMIHGFSHEKTTDQEQTLPDGGPLATESVNCQFNATTPRVVSMSLGKSETENELDTLAKPSELAACTSGRSK